MLLPINDSRPTGPDLSFSPEFDQIAELRRFDDPTLDQGEWVRDIKTADWPGVVRLCADLLATQTKDLRLAGWMTEALAHTRGFAGMAEGLEVCASLSESFWEILHPQPDEDLPMNELGERFEQRIGNLSWLLGQVVEVAHTQPLIVGKADGAAFGRRIIEAVRARKPSDADADLEPNEAQIAQALAQTPADALMGSLEGAQAALDALARLQAVVDTQLGLEGPNFSNARTALQDTQHMLRRFAKERGLLQTTDAESADVVQPVEASGNQAPSFSGGAPATRAQALAQLRQVAEFFRHTEPHSPVAYLVGPDLFKSERRWGAVQGW